MCHFEKIKKQQVLPIVHYFQKQFILLKDFHQTHSFFFFMITHHYLVLRTLTHMYCTLNGLMVGLELPFRVVMEKNMIIAPEW